MSLTPNTALSDKGLLLQQNYSLLTAEFPAPDPKDSKYVRHTSQPLGNGALNGLTRPVRRVTISGVHLAFDQKDKNGLVAAYSGQEDIEELYLLADTIVVSVPLLFPQTNVFVFARELRFEGTGSFIKTTPQDAGYRAPTNKDGKDGLKGGNIGLFIEKFTPAPGGVRKYFITTGGSGQDPDSGGWKISQTVQHLKPMTETEWSDVFSYSNRRMKHEEGSKDGMVFYWAELSFPSWNEYNTKCGGTGNQSNIVYVEINNTHYYDAFHIKESDRYVVKSWGTKGEPGTGGDALPPGKPGLGGAGGNLTVTVGIPRDYYDVSGGGSGAQHQGTAGALPGTPNPAYWITFSGTARGGQHEFRSDIAVKSGRVGNASGTGPSPSAPKGADGALVDASWAIRLPTSVPTVANVMLQYAKDCVFTGHSDRAIEIMEPYKNPAARLNAVLRPPPPGRTCPDSASWEAKGAFAEAEAMLIRYYQLDYAHRSSGHQQMAHSVQAALLEWDAAEKRFRQLFPDDEDIESTYYSDFDLSAEVLGDSLAHAQSVKQTKDFCELAASRVDYYGNPPGWAPSLSLEAAAGIYESILKNSLQELYTAYYLEKSWNEKTDKALAVKNLLGALNDRTKDAQGEMQEARDEVGGLLQDWKQLVQEIDDLNQKLEKRFRDLRAEADYKMRKKEEQDAIAAGFKISGALLKALPLPEPFQAIAGGVGSVFDITSSFIESGGDDSAFNALKTEVNSVCDPVKNPDLLTAFNKDFDLELAGNDKLTKDLDKAALDAKKNKADIDEVYGTEVSALREKKTAEEEFLRLKKEQENLVKGGSTAKSADWIAIETKRVEAERVLRNKNSDVAAVETKIKGQQASLKLQKAELTKAKTARAAQVKSTMKQVRKAADGIATIGKTVNKLMVSPTQLNAKYNQIMKGLKDSDNEFQNIARQIEYLAPKKEDLTKRLASLNAELGKLSDTISKNLVVANELRSQVENSAGVLDPAALVFIQSLGQDAHADLQKFLYFVVKAYEYYMVQPYKQSYLTAQKTFEDLRRVLEPHEFKVDFPDARGVGDTETPEQRQERFIKLVKQPSPARLTDKDFDLLKMVYEKPLREMGNELARQLMTGAGKLMETKKHVSLTAHDLQPLNDAVASKEKQNSMPFNLLQLRQVEAGRERQRIKNIKVVSAKCRKLGDRFPDQVSFKFIHIGKSIVRAGGKLFAFEPEARNNKGLATARVTYVTDAGNQGAESGWKIAEGSMEGSVSKDNFWQPAVTSQANLLQKLLNSKDLITLSEFRPGIFSDFLLDVEFNPAESKVSFLELGLDLELEMGNVPLQEVFVCATNNQGLAVPIQANQKDKGGLVGGLGRYVAVYDGQQLAKTPLELSVPQSYGQYTHAGWRVDGTSVSGAGPLKVNKSSYIVAEYTQAKAVTA